MPGLALVLVFLAALIAGGVFGFFYAWSVTVMRGLAASDAVSAITVMQRVNATIMTPWFALLFFGAPLAAAAAALAAYLAGLREPALWLGLASAVYLVGCFMVTVVMNVPMNDALAAVDARAATDPAAVWRDYAGPWTLWNHLRTAACGVAVLCTLVALWRWPN